MEWPCILTPCFLCLSSSPVSLCRLELLVLLLVIGSGYETDPTSTSWEYVYRKRRELMKSQNLYDTFSVCWDVHEISTYLGLDFTLSLNRITHESVETFRCTTSVTWNSKVSFFCLHNSINDSFLYDDPLISMTQARNISSNVWMVLSRCLLFRGET